MNRHPPSNYGDEPPAYDHEATSFLSHDDSPTTTPRHNGPSMRLLPTSSNVESDMSRSYRSASPSQYSQLQSEYPETIPAGAPSEYDSRFYQVPTATSPSRPPSSLGTAPTMPPPAGSLADTSVYPSIPPRTGSPTRPGARDTFVLPQCPVLDTNAPTSMVALDPGLPAPDMAVVRDDHYPLRLCSRNQLLLQWTVALILVTPVMTMTPSVVVAGPSITILAAACDHS